MSQLPSYTTDLLEQLDKQYPPTCIRQGETLEHAHRYAGKRELIENLQTILERQLSSEMDKRNVHS